MNRTRTRRRHRHGACMRRGFTLAEVMVATVILATAVVAVTHLFSGMSRGLLFRENLIAATGLAQDRTERLLQEDLAATKPGSDTVGRFRRSWSVSNDATVAWLSVSVVWNEINGSERRVDVRYARAH